jgi:uncharacterized protein YeaO (DUF488 family)
VETNPRLGYGSQKQMQSKSKELKQGVCHTHCGFANYIKKYHKAKEEEELWKLLKYFTMQNITFKKIL